MKNILNPPVPVLRAGHPDSDIGTESGALIHLLGSHNCTRVTHFTSAFHLCLEEESLPLQHHSLLPHLHTGKFLLCN